jgi:hypothetical protein
MEFNGQVYKSQPVTITVGNAVQQQQKYNNNPYYQQQQQQRDNL